MFDHQWGAGVLHVGCIGDGWDTVGGIDEGAGGAWETWVALLKHLVVGGCCNSTWVVSLAQGRVWRLDDLDLQTRLHFSSR